MPAVRFLSEDVWVSGVSDKGMAHNIAVQSSKAGGTDAHPLCVCLLCPQSVTVEQSVGASAPKQNSKHSKHAQIRRRGARD
jgi:hypothetical protein